MILIEVTTVFADFDSDDKQLTKAKAKGKGDFQKSKTIINPSLIQLIRYCEFDTKILEVWYENDILYLEADYETLGAEWQSALDEIEVNVDYEEKDRK